MVLMRSALLVLLTACVGCGVVPQPESARTVAAFEVLLPTVADRNDFLAVLRVTAEAEGLHVDSSDAQTLQGLSEVSPITIHAAVWRGKNDDEVLASVMDLPDNLGRAWISFSKGQDPEFATRFQDRAMRQIRLRWPKTEQLPIMPTGAIPLPSDLQLTPQGYRVLPTASGKYELPSMSPLIVGN